MSFAGYLKIEEIKGESVADAHKDQIDIYGVEMSALQNATSATGSGRSRGRAQVSDLTLHKFMDAASPYLALACMNGKSFKKIEFFVRKDSGDAHLDYLHLILERCSISGYEMRQNSSDSTSNDVVQETIKIAFEKIEFKYTVQADDHSAGTPHTTTYDIAAGKA